MTISVVDYATGVKGSYCIGRKRETYWHYWNPSGWAGSGYVFENRKLAESIAAMIAVIEAAKAMRKRLHYMGNWDVFDAALAKLERGE